MYISSNSKYIKLTNTQLNYILVIYLLFKFSFVLECISVRVYPILCILLLNYIFFYYLIKERER